MCILVVMSSHLRLWLKTVWCSQPSYVCYITRTSVRHTHTHTYTHHFSWFNHANNTWCRPQWLRGLRRRSAAAHFLGLWVRIPPEAWMFVCCKCCVLSGRGLCDGLITRPEESYRRWCVVVCDLQTSWMRRPWPSGVLKNYEAPQCTTSFNMQLLFPLLVEMLSLQTRS